MPLALLSPLLLDAAEREYAVPSFNVLSLETARAVIAAAELEESPVIVAVAELHFPYTDFATLGPALVKMAERSHVPVVLHLDHAQTLNVVGDAIRAGFTSFQYDGYGLSMADRLERTRSVVQLVHSMDFAVEAEVGHITRRGTDSERAAELIADVATAVEFCEGTGVDVIAAAVGNVHGLRTGESHLDEELVRSLVEKVPAAISLHGGSGLAGADVTRAIKLGVRKISYFNNLGREALTAMQSAIAGSDDPAFTTVMAAGNAAYQAAVVRQLRAYAASGKAAAVETSHPKADH